MKTFADHLARNDIISHGDYDGELDKQFPDDDHKSYFLRWFNRRAEAAQDAEQKRLEDLCLIPEKLIERMATMNFWDDDERLDLVEILDNEVKVSSSSSQVSRYL